MSQRAYLRISTLQMHYFIEVASCGSFTSASQHLYTTQSTLSKTISALEKNLDVQLFIRSHKRLYLTEAGRHLYEKWKKILSELEHSVEESRILQGGHADTLTIGILDSYDPKRTLNPILHRFFQEYPQSNISVSACPAQEIRKQLITGNLDVAFTVLYDLEQLSEESFDSAVIGECDHSVAMLSVNPLAKKEYLHVSELKDCDFVGISPLYTPSYCGMIKDLCASHGFEPHFVRYTENAISLIYNLIHENDVFICDKYYRDYQNPSMQMVQFRPLVHTKSGIAVIWKKNNTKKELLNLIGLLRQTNV